MMTPAEVIANQKRWQRYVTVEGTPTYGTYEQRRPEYRVVGSLLAMCGLENDELVIDIGAGSCDLDHFLRVDGGWRGKYLPYDGAVQGLDLREWLPELRADAYVSIETLEHLVDPETLCRKMIELADRCVVVTTPNADTVDVLSTDSTHITPISRADLEDWGFTVFTAQFNPQYGDDDTLVGVWKK